MAFALVSDYFGGTDPFLTNGVYAALKAKYTGEESPQDQAQAFGNFFVIQHRQPWGAFTEPDGTSCNPSANNFGLPNFMAPPGGSSSGLGLISTGASSAGVPIIGSILGSIFGFIQQKAINIRNFEQALCQTQTIYNFYTPQIDEAVYSGQMSAAAGIAYFAQMRDQLKAILTNAATKAEIGASLDYKAILDAQADFVTSFYPAIAPAGAQPGVSEPSNPGAVSVLPQASVGALPLGALAMPYGSIPLSTGTSIAATFNGSFGTMLLIGVALLLVLVLILK